MRYVEWDVGSSHCAALPCVAFCKTIIIAPSSYPAARQNAAVPAGVPRAPQLCLPARSAALSSRSFANRLSSTFSFRTSIRSRDVDSTSRAWLALSSALDCAKEDSEASRRASARKNAGVLRGDGERPSLELLS